MRSRAVRQERRNASVELQAGLAFATLLLAGIGCVAVFSATAPFALDHAIAPHFVRHAVALVIGAALAFVVSRLPVRTWRLVAFPLWGLAVAALVATGLIGLFEGGAQRWLGTGLGFAFQPAEIAKLATVLCVAVVLAEREGRRSEVAPRRFGAAFALAGVPAALCLLQPDLGNAVLLLGLTALLLFAAGAPLRTLLGPAVLGAIGIGAYSLLNPYAMRRWLGFLDPWERASGEGFQLVQSFVAFARGGVFGVGPGNGRQQLFYLPEAHNDFILSVVAEELGLIGVLVVLGAFAALAVLGIRVALAARQRFAMLLASGMTALLVVPAALNAAVVMGVVPTKGLTLPFLSYGRTSLLMACFALGVILGVARGESEERRT
jgi:cell division protein FtsW